METMSRTYEDQIKYIKPVLTIGTDFILMYGRKMELSHVPDCGQNLSGT